MKLFQLIYGFTNTKLMKIFSNRNINGQIMRVAIYVAVWAAALAASSPRANASAKEDWEIDVDTTIFMREARELQEIIVKPKKEKYSKRNNPAVELMERVRRYQRNGDPTRTDNYSYDQYDKTTLGLLDFSDKELKRHKFLKNYIDTTRYGSRQVLYVLMKEKNATQLYSDEGKRHKTVVRSRNSSGIDEAFNDGNVGTMLEEMFREVNIYSDDITMMANRFVSPLSAIGADYYKYFITDTLDIDGTRCIQLTFTPHNHESFSFMGNLYI